MGPGIFSLILTIFCHVVYPHFYVNYLFIIMLNCVKFYKTSINRKKIICIDIICDIYCLLSIILYNFTIFIITKLSVLVYVILISKNVKKYSEK